MSYDSSVVVVFSNLDEAEAAVKKLGEGGFPIQHVSIIAKDLGSEKKVHGFVTSCDVAKSTAKTGAWVGGLFGLLVGAAFVWVPGMGPLIVAGSLASAVLGGLEGAAAGAAFTGTLGWLSALGIAKQHILKYEESVRAGKYLLVAHGTVEDVAKAERLLQGSTSDETNKHSLVA